MQTNNGPWDNKHETMCMSRGGQRRERALLKRKRRDADSGDIGNITVLGSVRGRVVCSSWKDASGEIEGIVDATAWIPKLRMES
jgi:hypothetical protein